MCELWEFARVSVKVFACDWIGLQREKERILLSLERFSLSDLSQGDVLKFEKASILVSNFGFAVVISSCFAMLL